MLRVVTRWAVAPLVAVLAGCTAPAPEPSRLGRLEGQVQAPGPVRGDAYLFLLPPGGGVEEAPALPRYVTAVPELRRAAGNGRYLFSAVEPGPWRLWGFVDANGDADLTVEVLAQPGEGDWVAAQAVALEVQPGQGQEVDLALEQHRRQPLPAFRVEGYESGGVVEWRDVPQELVSLTVWSDGLGVLGGEPRFVVRLVDEDGDGSADDVDGDGVPDLLPRFFLRWVPRPGQEAPVDGQGRPVQVIVPLPFNPLPFLPALEGRLDREVVAPSLQLFYVPRALSVAFEPERGRVVTTLGAVPVGEYELWALTDEGGAWFMPNGLATRRGGPVASQGLQVRVVRSAAVDAGN